MNQGRYFTYYVLVLPTLYLPPNEELMINRNRNKIKSNDELQSQLEGGT